MRHKHHIIPKHRGGTNDPSNLVEISLTQHAMFHFCEWQLHRKRADYVAWKRLVGNLNDEELVHQKLIIGGENGGRKVKELGLGIFALSKEERSENSKKYGKIGGKKSKELGLGIFGLSKEERLRHSMENIRKAIENDTPEKARERGLKGGAKGNKSQREKFESEGRTIAEQKWIVTTPNGETLEVSNLKKFCRENNLLPNKMCEVGKGKWKQHRGYTCKRLE